MAIVIILMNATEFTLDLDLICSTAFAKLDFHDACQSGTFCFLARYSGMWQV
jgi:hypothetical protein